MADTGQRGSGRHKLDHHNKGSLSSWSMVHQHQVKEQSAMSINKKILNIIAERDAALEERDRALLEKKKALEERDAAISRKNMAIRERNDAIMERDHALEALRNARSNQFNFVGQRGTKRTHQDSSSQQSYLDEPLYGARGAQAADASAYSAGNDSYQTKRAKENKSTTSSARSRPKKPRILGEDLNKCKGSDGLKSRNDWDAKDLGLNIVYFDESNMPLPGCSCTGEFRNCYKWGNGGWQSSCCTTTLSCYPLPPMPNKRYARMSGRKMSGSVFTRLLTRLASEGYDFSVPVDLKDHWSKHGTNRYITIK